MINLSKDTIDREDIESLISWLRSNPRLTKGCLTLEFEKRWCNWLKTRYALFVNSGSSANLAMMYTAILSKRLKNRKVVVSAISWPTTIAPIIQLGLEPILCDADKENIGLDINHFETICHKEKPAAVILVHVLGVPCEMDAIGKICRKNNIILFEDSCESVGSTYKGKKVGTFGLMSSFSFYFSHQISTIEGGMICTNDKALFNILKSIRCHGWDRDLDKKTQRNLRNEYNIDDFHSLYTFYYPGFNFRSTDLQAFIGLRQLKKIDLICKKRNENLLLYDSLIKNDFWKLKIKKENYISSLAYPVITPKIDKLVKAFSDNRIETRPLVSGSIGRQPFWRELYGEKSFEFADIVHKYGLYLPNNHQLAKEEIKSISNIANKVINNH